MLVWIVPTAWPAAALVLALAAGCSGASVAAPARTPSPVPAVTSAFSRPRFQNRTHSPAASVEAKCPASRTAAAEELFEDVAEVAHALHVFDADALALPGA